MYPSKHFMVDIETLDTQPSAVILSIGVVCLQDEMTFYAELNPVFQQTRTVSESTVEWWKKQGNKPEGREELYLALINLSQYFGRYISAPIIWSKGTDFDVAILAHAYRQYALPVPWAYSNVRDFRTLKKLHPQLHYTENPNPHNALADAVCQARQLHQIMAYNPMLQWG